MAENQPPAHCPLRCMAPTRRLLPLRPALHRAPGTHIRLQSQRKACLLFTISGLALQPLGVVNTGSGHDTSCGSCRLLVLLGTVISGLAAPPVVVEVRVLHLKAAAQEVELGFMGAGALPAAPGPWPAPQGMIPTAPQGMIPTAPMVFMALTTSTVQPHVAPLSANSPEKISAALAELGPAVSVRRCLRMSISYGERRNMSQALLSSWA